MPTPLIPTDVSDKVIVVTGASAGIGAAAVRRLAEAGAIVVPIGRSPERTAAVASEVGVEPVVADFGHLDEVRRAADTVLSRCGRIDVLANNAGGIFPRRTVTENGHELTFQANHLAGFLLTNLLLPRLLESAKDGGARVITTSSFGNLFSKVDFDDIGWIRRRYGRGWMAYCATKLMNIMFVRELAGRTAHTGLEAVAFHPDPGKNGIPLTGTGPDSVATNFAQDTWQMRLFKKIPGLRNNQLTGERGSQPLTWLVSASQVVGSSGSYYNGMAVSDVFNAQAKDPAASRRLWDLSLDLVGEYL